MQEAKSIRDALEKTGQVRACLFDMDGLIFDSERCFMEQLSVVMHEYGYHLTREIYCETLGMSGDMLQKVMLGHYGQEYPFHEIGQRARARVDTIALSVGLAVKQDIQEILALLKGRGVLCAVASGSRTEAVEKYLGAAGLDQYFDVAVGGEQVSHSKPAPDIFELASLRLDIPPQECVVLEDSENGIRAGKAAGCTTICVPDLKMPRKEFFRDIDFLVCYPA